MEITSVDRDYIVLDFENKRISGRTKAKDWKEHIGKLKGVLES